MKQMKCLKDMVYAGKRVKAGQLFPVRRGDVRILKAIGKAEIHYVPPVVAPVIETRAIEVEAPTVEPTVRTKRKYTRRDMTAE